MKNSVIVDACQILNNTGVTYRASGNLFIAKQTAKTVPKLYQGQRGSVVAFSSGSAIRMRRYLRECRAKYSTMVTLTYPFSFPTNGTETKEHLRRFLQELRREATRCGKNAPGRNHSSFWFLEFQERGAPHYHIFTTWAPKRDWVAKRWYEICGTEDIRHLSAGTRTEYMRSGRAGTISYASKYAAKLIQKTVPVGFEKVGRFWGVFGDRVVVAAAIFISRAEEANSEVKKALKQLHYDVKHLIQSGEMTIFLREEGVLLASMNTKRAMDRIRFAVSRLAGTTLKKHDYFEDAEVDDGNNTLYA